jgi:co-chaperonin GroES (HSP10)
MNLTVVGPRVIVRPDRDIETTASGIQLVTDDVQFTGTVLAVGKDMTCPSCDAHVPHTVQVGDRVIYAPYGGERIEWGGEDVMILDIARDILGIIEHEPQEAA